MGFEDDIFKITPLSIDINDSRGLRATQLTRDALRNMGRVIALKKDVLLEKSDVDKILAVIQKLRKNVDELTDQH